ncbi:putative lipid-binding transport protein (Tim44 family) [Pseudochelatococcus contaminans]|uniref:Putative lipid-binding transport protein (Tim44 family) n=2 Tax=Pseudochelatococcus contaminans TaxID=1538103 RepID=A0A7W5Z6I4_9HYPH|nr:putative lipid-binding transport protein (Tim44 family) [Pseudochelatococcus contaminans]
MRRTGRVCPFTVSDTRKKDDRDMQDSFDIVTIVFLCLAVFVIWRLRSVLGQRTGNERPPFDPFARRERNGKPGAPANGAQNGKAVSPADDQSGGDNIVRLPGPANDTHAPDRSNDPDRWKGFAELGSPVANGLDAIVAAESSFDAPGFREGAKSAYELIVTAFAQGDRKTLKGLLSREVFEGFDRAITEREQRGEVVNTTFVSVDSADFIAVDVQALVAQITVRFVSKLITATYDVDGKVIDGAPDAVVDVTDTWTFSRTLRSRDPNWLLIATESGG